METPSDYPQIPGTCAQHSRIEKKLDRIIQILGDGRTHFATIGVRLKRIEQVVYGGVSVVLIAVLVGIVALVVR